MEQVREKLKFENPVEEKIANYLIAFCEKEPGFINKILNEKKTLKECIEYIKSEARKQAVGNSAIIDDETVYGWAVHYFDEENLDFKKVNAKVGHTNKKSNKQEKNIESEDYEENEDDIEEDIEDEEIEEEKVSSTKNISKSVNEKEKKKINRIGEQLSLELF